MDSLPIVSLEGGIRGGAKAQAQALERALEDYRFAVNDAARSRALDSLAALAETQPQAICAALRYRFEPATATTEDYRAELRTGMGEAAAERLFTDLSDLAAAVRDSIKRKIVIINATFTSGGVAEMFRTQANILGALGIDVEWHTTHAGEAQAYAEIGRKVYDAIQGGTVCLTDADKALWRRENERLARVLVGVADDPDVAAVFLEDYHPIHLAGAFKRRNPGLRVVWRGHNDHHGIIAGLAAGTGVWRDVIKPQLAFLSEGDAALFQPHSVPPDAHDLTCGVFVEPAGIDPLALKNRPLSRSQLSPDLETVAPGIDPNRPALVAGGRYVMWKGLLPLLRAWVLLAEDHPTIDLVLFGAVGEGDTRKVRYAEALQKEISAIEQNHPALRGRVHLLKLRGEDIRPFYALAARHKLPFCQPSIREGYGLMADEAARQGAVPFTTLQGGLRRYGDHPAMAGFYVDAADVIDQIPDPAHMYVHNDRTGGVAPSGVAVSALEAQLYTSLHKLLTERAQNPQAFAVRYGEALGCAHALALSACLVVMSRDYLALCVATPEQVQTHRVSPDNGTPLAARLTEAVLDTSAPTWHAT